MMGQMMANPQMMQQMMGGRGMFGANANAANNAQANPFGAFLNPQMLQGLFQPPANNANNAAAANPLAALFNLPQPNAAQAAPAAPAAAAPAAAAPAANANNAAAPAANADANDQDMADGDRSR